MLRVLAEKGTEISLKREIVTHLGPLQPQREGSERGLLLMAELESAPAPPGDLASA